jgi:hypothetical protein
MQGYKLVDRILITLRYTFFSRSLTIKNSGVKRAWPIAILGWVTDREVFPDAHKWEKVHRKDRVWLIHGASLWYYWSIRSNDRQTWSGWGVTIGIRADLWGFTGAYLSAETDTIVYGSGMWIHTHDEWVIWEGHSMIHMLLTGHTVCVYQYWTYKRGQEGIFLAWGWPMGTSVF